MPFPTGAVPSIVLHRWSLLNVFPFGRYYYGEVRESKDRSVVVVTGCSPARRALTDSVEDRTWQE